MLRSMNLAVTAATFTATLAAATSALAVQVQWADLTSYDGVSVVQGDIIVGPDTIGVTYVGAGNAFVQTNGGTNYWTQGSPAPYTGGLVNGVPSGLIVDNAPGSTDIIAMSAGGLKTITFSQAVSDVYLALVSWNGNSGTFTQPITFVSSGCGFWGCGNPVNITANSFDGSGELHGILKFSGTFTSVSFTDRPEGWHGIQIGIGGLAPPPGIPEPSTWAMMIIGFASAGAMLRRRRAQLA